MTSLSALLRGWHANGRKDGSYPGGRREYRNGNGKAVVAVSPNVGFAGMKVCLHFHISWVVACRSPQFRPSFVGLSFPTH